MKRATVPAVPRHPFSNVQLELGGRYAEKVTSLGIAGLGQDGRMILPANVKRLPR
jgi:hypothetical protein